MADFPEGWYPSPTSRGRDQWWNGSAWTPHTQPASGDPRRPGPPRVARASVPAALVAMAIGAASLVFNPLFLFSFVALLLGGAAFGGARAAWPSRASTVVAVLGCSAIVAGLVGAVLVIVRQASY